MKSEDVRNLSILAAALTPVWAVFLYAGTMFFTARWSGWSSLAMRYATGREPEGKKFSWQSLGVSKWGGYNNAVYFLVSDKGLFLRLNKPFGAFHPPLLLPWKDLKWLGEGRIFGLEYVEVAVPLKSGRNVWRLPKKVADAARAKGWL